MIWSNEHAQWWRAESMGYTRSIEEAGRYGLHEATRIVGKATLDGALNETRTDPYTLNTYEWQREVMVPAPESRLMMLKAQHL